MVAIVELMVAIATPKERPAVAADFCARFIASYVFTPVGALVEAAA